MDNCTINYINIFDTHSTYQTCKYVTESCQQQSVQFIQLYYCTFNQSIPLLILLSIITLLLIYYALNILTNHYLTYSVEEFIQKLNMSQGLAGVTFLAFANGAPDIMTTIVAGSSSSQSVALIPLGSLYGAAIFNMAFILSMVIKFSPNQSLIISKKEALIPLAFYILGTLYIFLVSMLYGKINQVISIIFLSLYIVYLFIYERFIVIVFYEENSKQVIKRRQRQSKSQNNQISSNQQSIASQQIQLNSFITQKSVDEVEQHKRSYCNKIQGLIEMVFRFVFDFSIPPTNKDRWIPINAVVSLILSPVIILIPFGISQSFSLSFLNIPYAAWFTLPSFLLLIHSIYCIITKQKPNKIIIAYSIYSFIINICFITTMCSILISLVELIQFLTNINSVFLGLTVFSWANSIGDYLSIVAFAKKGNTSTAVAGIFSGPLMSFLLGFGIACTLNSLQGQYQFVIFDFKGSKQQKLSDAIVLSVIVLATIYMIWIFVQIIRKSGIFKNFQQKCSLIYYIGLLIIGLVLTITANRYKQQ